MKNLLFLSVFLFAFVLVSCNDDSIDDGKEFSNCTVNLDRENDIVIMEITFWATISSDLFYIYMSTDNVEGAEFRIECRNSSFEVLGESGNGLYNVSKFTGTSTLNGTKYNLEIPISSLELDFSNEWNISYWLVEESNGVGDRYPATGTKLIANVL